MIIITGHKNQGKTTHIKKIITFLQHKEKSVCGFYSEKIMKDTHIIGYDILTIPEKQQFKFLRIHGNENQQKIGPFYINKFALAEGISQIKKAIINQVDYFVIDEVGKLELNNKGWYDLLEKAFTEFKGEIILAVRTDFIEKVIEKWQLKEVQIIDTKTEIETIFTF